MPEITVVTLTRERPALLLRAIESVEGQTLAELFEHVVMIDDCDETLRFLEKNAVPMPGLIWRMNRREPASARPYGQYLPGSFQYKASRSAFLRNLAIRDSSSRWISFLDDDNEFEADHLASLLDHARRHELRAVYSYMSLWHRDGRPYLDEMFPWERDPARTGRLYREMQARGVFSSGSNVVADRADPDSVEDPVRSVDTSEWLLSRQLLLEHAFDEHYSDHDAAVILGEDGKLLNRLLEHGVTVGCTERATLRYYLGGYSNSFQEAAEAPLHG